MIISKKKFQEQGIKIDKLLRKIESLEKEKAVQRKKFTIKTKEETIEAVGTAFYVYQRDRYLTVHDGEDIILWFKGIPQSVLVENIN